MSNRLAFSEFDFDDFENFHKKTIDKNIIFSDIGCFTIKNDKIYGRLVINNTVRGDIEYPLYSEEEIEKAGFFKKITSALSFIIFGGNAE